MLSKVAEDPEGQGAVAGAERGERLRREARWKQALGEQVKPEYRFGLDQCGNHAIDAIAHWLMSTQA